MTCINGCEQYERMGNIGIKNRKNNLFILLALSLKHKGSFSLDNTGKQNLSTLKMSMLIGILFIFDACKKWPDWVIFPILGIIDVDILLTIV
jgi:hypothetical protein